MKMRKLLCLLLSLLMLVSLVACGDKDDSDDKGGKSGGKTAKPETVVEKFVDCFIDADVGGVFDLINPDMLDYAMEEEGMSKSDLNDMADELSEELKSMYEYVEEMTGEKLKMSYEITYEWELDEDELEDIQSEYEDAGVEIEEGKVFEVDLTMEIAGEEDTQTMEIVVVKIDGKWYLEPSAMGNF